RRSGRATRTRSRSFTAGRCLTTGTESPCRAPEQTRIEMRLRTALLTFLLLTPLAHAADNPEQEVVVAATRANLIKLGKEVQLAEYRFYKRYNDLNTVRKYIIDCTIHARTGSHFESKYCEPRYQTQLEAEEAQQFYRMLMQGAGTFNEAPKAWNQM